MGEGGRGDARGSPQVDQGGGRWDARGLLELGG